MLHSNVVALVVVDRNSLRANYMILSLSGVEIGCAVLTARNCYISAGTYQIDGVERPVMHNDVISKGPIRIGDGAWIGTSAVILDGITVGRDAVIGAGAVVTRNVPERAIMVGVPARQIGTRG